MRIPEVLKSFFNSLLSHSTHAEQWRVQSRIRIHALADCDLILSRWKFRLRPSTDEDNKNEVLKINEIPIRKMFYFYTISRMDPQMRS